MTSRPNDASAIVFTKFYKCCKMQLFNLFYPFCNITIIIGLGPKTIFWECLQLDMYGSEKRYVKTKSQTRDVVQAVYLFLLSSPITYCKKTIKKIHNILPTWHGCFIRCKTSAFAGWNLPKLWEFQYPPITNPQVVNP